MGCARRASHGPYGADGELVLREVWGRVLNIEPEDIGTKDNFLSLGGDFINAVELVAVAGQHGIRLTAAAILANPELTKMAAVALLGEESDQVYDAEPWSLLPPMEVDEIMNETYYGQESIQTQGSEMVAFEQYGLHNIAKLSEDAKDACDFSNLLAIQPARWLASAADAKSKDAILLGGSAAEEKLSAMYNQNYFNYPLVLEALLDDGHVDLQITYDSNSISCDVLRALPHHFGHVVRQLLQLSDRPLCTISVAGEWELEPLFDSEVPEIVDPKGLVMEHGSVCTSQMAIAKRLGMTPGVRMLQFSALLQLIGTVGEIDIQGLTVLRGYLNNPEKTDEYNPDGTIEFLSRKDTQVKVRGLRIELGDIEHHIQNALKGVCQTAVGVFQTEEQRLSDSTQRPSRDKLTQYSLAPNNSRKPETAAEIRMQQLWAEELKIAAESMGRDDSFLQRGGDSLVDIRLVAAARKIGLSLAVKDIFVDPRLWATSSITQWV
ncbi:nonribosomal peptide synthase [Trichoderma cornu-damae]|uniref:Nonribosomal peptide synthase n=1 Tax=Trichoderma cornu-damae TaxID=654480 RepID=A0A9P8QN52_9HYPO|nr:nonribosomal peptide synthase [Trichoderma cornu-damae]